MPRAFALVVAMLVSTIVSGALSGCSKPTTVRVDFRTQDGGLLDSLQATISVGSLGSLGGANASKPHVFSFPSAASEGSFLIPLPDAVATNVTVELVGQESGRTIGGVMSIESVPHKEERLSITLGNADIVDGSVIVDAGVDAMTNDMTDGSACGIFCDNFDDRTSLQGKWDKVQPNGNGATSDGTISTQEFVSPPSSAHFVSHTYASGNGDGLVLIVTVPFSGATYSVDFDVKIGSGVGSNGYVNLWSVGTPTTYNGGFTREGATQIAFDYFITAADMAIIHPVNFANLADTNWHHVHYTETLDATKGSALGTLDGNVVLQYDNVRTWAGALPTSLDLTLGTSAHMQVAPVDIYFDNFVVR